MCNIQKRIHFPFRGCGLFISLMISLVSPWVHAADILLPTLKIGTDVFTNVTVYQMTATDIFHRHGQGFGNAKISALDDETLILLGLKTVTPKPVSESFLSSAQISAAIEQVKTALATVNLTIPSEDILKEQIARVTVTPQLVYGILGGLVFGYLLFCLCLLKMCVNAGSKPGLLIWLPFLQLFPLLRAAKMPAWWFLIFFLPVLNVSHTSLGFLTFATVGIPLLAHLLWCARIARACGKGFFSALMLFLPVTNILALLYFAFSGRSGEERPMGKSFRNEELPGLASA